MSLFQTLRRATIHILGQRVSANMIGRSVVAHYGTECTREYRCDDIFHSTDSRTVLGLA
jgi:hypothetical protein